jgi:hypothetical protein
MEKYNSADCKNLQQIYYSPCSTYIEYNTFQMKTLIFFHAIQSRLHVGVIHARVPSLERKVFAYVLNISINQVWDSFITFVLVFLRDYLKSSRAFGSRNSNIVCLRYTYIDINCTLYGKERPPAHTG